MSYTGRLSLVSAPLEHGAKSNEQNVWDRTHCSYCQRSNVTPMVSDGLVYPPTFSFSSDEQRSLKTSFLEVVPPYSTPQAVSSFIVSAATGAVCSQPGTRYSSMIVCCSSLASRESPFGNVSPGACGSKLRSRRPLQEERLT